MEAPEAALTRSKARSRDLATAALVLEVPRTPTKLGAGKRLSLESRIRHELNLNPTASRVRPSGRRPAEPPDICGLSVGVPPLGNQRRLRREAAEAEPIRLVH